jgi:hypothetical protein
MESTDASGGVSAPRISPLSTQLYRGIISFAYDRSVPVSTTSPNVELRFAYRSQTFLTTFLIRES